MKFIHSNNIFKDRRSDLRNNCTKQEQVLWFLLKQKNLGFKFRRQHSIGPYIVDFYCAEKRLVIEIDGAHHTGEENQTYDRERSRYLASLNHKVIRFWNSEIDNNLDQVVAKIIQVLN